MPPAVRRANAIQARSDWAASFAATDGEGGAPDERVVLLVWSDAEGSTNGLGVPRGDGAVELRSSRPSSPISPAREGTGDPGGQAGIVANHWVRTRRGQ
jgi:hypothetical protein